MKKPRTPAKPNARKPRQPQIREAVKQAIAAMEYNAASLTDAARNVGMTYNSLCRALARPHIIAYRQQVKEQADADIPALLLQARAMAIREGMKLLAETKSESVRAKMVDLFMTPRRDAAEKPKTPKGIKGLPAEQGVYHIMRPEPREDMPTASDQVQDAEIIGQSPESETRG